jgi:hypothetical protein
MLNLSHNALRAAGAKALAKVVGNNVVCLMIPLFVSAASSLSHTDNHHT